MRWNETGNQVLIFSKIILNNVFIDHICSCDCLPSSSWSQQVHWVNSNFPLLAHENVRFPEWCRPAKHLPQKCFLTSAIDLGFSFPLHKAWPWMYFGWGCWKTLNYFHCLLQNTYPSDVNVLSKFNLTYNGSNKILISLYGWCFMSFFFFKVGTILKCCH